jgi:hypothetical protein
VSRTPLCSPLAIVRAYVFDPLLSSSDSFVFLPSTLCSHRCFLHRYDLPEIGGDPLRQAQLLITQGQMSNAVFQLGEYPTTYQAVRGSNKVDCTFLVSVKPPVELEVAKDTEVCLSLHSPQLLNCLLSLTAFHMPLLYANHV